jgi:hypothetical protein
MRNRVFIPAFFITTSFVLLAHADPERVTLASGAVYEGELVEKVPSDHVTIKLATGEVRRFEWKDLAALPPVTIAPPVPVTTQAAHVRVESDTAGAVLMRNPGYGTTFASQEGPGTISVVTSDQNPVPICYAPCSAEVDPRATYYLTGAFISRTRSFPIPEGDTVLHVNPGSSAVASAGGWMLGVGIMAVLFGAIELPISFADVNNDPLKPQQQGLNGWQWAGIGTLIAGASLALLSIPFIVGGLTHASVNGISVAHGKVRITPRGLVF